VDYKFQQPVRGSIGEIRYQCTLEWRNGKLIADEPETAGGKDTGPDPFTLLLSSLASCTLITLRMYIDRKGWEIPEIVVNANLFQTRVQEKLATTIDCDLSFPGAQLSPEQKSRLGEIAEHCPISRILEGSLKVRTYVYRDEDIDKKLSYKNDDVTVVWKPELCKHSGRCVTQLPQVFNLETKPWVTMTGAPTQAIVDQVHKCPTGALSIFQHQKGS
jgi:putative redox protein